MQLKERTWGSYSNKTESKPLLGQVHSSFPGKGDNEALGLHVWEKGGLPLSSANILLASHLKRSRHTTKAVLILLCERKRSSLVSQTCQPGHTLAPANAPDPCCPCSPRTITMKECTWKKNGVFAQRSKITKQDWKRRKHWNSQMLRALATV